MASVIYFEAFQVVGKHRFGELLCGTGPGRVSVEKVPHRWAQHSALVDHVCQWESIRQATVSRYAPLLLKLFPEDAMN